MVSKDTGYRTGTHYVSSVNEVQRLIDAADFDDQLKPAIQALYKIRKIRREVGYMSSMGTELKEQVTSCLDQLFQLKDRKWKDGAEEEVGYEYLIGAVRHERLMYYSGDLTSMKSYLDVETKLAGQGSTCISRAIPLNGLMGERALPLSNPILRGVEPNDRAELLRYMIEINAPSLAGELKGVHDLVKELFGEGGLSGGSVLKNQFEKQAGFPGQVIAVLSGVDELHPAYDSVKQAIRNMERVHQDIREKMVDALMNTAQENKRVLDEIFGNPNA